MQVRSCLLAALTLLLGFLLACCASEHLKHDITQKGNKLRELIYECSLLPAPKICLTWMDSRVVGVSSVNHEVDMTDLANTQVNGKRSVSNITGADLSSYILA